LRAFLDHPQRRPAARRLHEPAEFLERLLGVVPPRLGRRESNEGDAFVGGQGVTPG
jgi:hypothetical protein